VSISNHIKNKQINMKKHLLSMCAGLMCSATLFAHTTSVFTPLPVSSPAKHSIRAEDRVVKDFHGVAAGGPIDVIVKLGSTETVRFEGDAEAIASLVTEVKSGILIIRPKTSWTSWAKKYENKKITAYVTAKDLSSLAMSGNGSLTVTGTVNAEELATILSGSGRIAAKIAVRKLTSVISGSGNLELSGEAAQAKVTISGSGRFSGKGITVEDLDTRISGSGIVNIHAETKINALITGSGHVLYSGDPEIQKRVIGSGGVSKM
jgi:hypothetical protein